MTPFDQDPAAREDEIEVEIADAWPRVAAAALNMLFSAVAVLPLIIGMLGVLAANFEQSLVANMGDYEAGVWLVRTWAESPWIWLGVLVYLAYLIWQAVLISRSGQSLGKKIIGLKVVKTDGGPAGFVGGVLLREIVFQLLGGFVCGFILGFWESVSGTSGLSWVGGYIPFLVCFVMLFTARDRRTLQDLLAGTVVVRLPKK